MCQRLTFQVSMLRKALGEHACIETVPRFGYRFVTRVEVLEDTQLTREPAPLVSASSGRESSGGAASTASRPRWILAAGLVPLVLALVSAGWMRGRSPESDAGTAPLANPLTAYPGSEGAPVDLVNRPAQH